MRHCCIYLFVLPTAHDIINDLISFLAPMMDGTVHFHSSFITFLFSLHCIALLLLRRR